MSILTKFFGRTASEGAAFALGTAVGPTLRPAVQELANAAWLAHPSHPVDAALIAEGVATGHIDPVWGAGEAVYTGIDGERFGNMVKAFKAGPGVSTAFQLWRRGIIDQGAFRKAAREAALEPEWIDALIEVKDVLLSPADLAMMRQQGFVDVARQHAESEQQGVTPERADLMFEISGLPPGVAEALEMWRRGIIDQATFAQIVREGHTKTKYTAALEVLKRVLLSPATLVNLFLRGWIERPEYHSRMALWGYDAADADDWYDASGRPAAPVQMMTAWARGVDGPDGSPMDEAQFRKGIRESDIRPEWASMLWGIRHAYPSLFQLRRAVQDGGISRARALKILHYERYEDQDAVALVDSWTTGTGTTAKGLTATDLANEYEALWITRAQYVSGLQQLGYSADNAAAKADAEDARRARRGRDALVARIHSLYVSHRLSRTATLDALGKASVPARVRDSLMPDWDVERDITADALTAAQIKKAFTKALMTRVEAIDRLEAKGYDAPDANIYLDQ